MELQKLILQLKEQKCPPAVLDRVMKQIAREEAPRRAPRMSVAWVLSIACLVAAAGFWQWQARKEARRAQVVQQTQQAFAYIGQALLHATAQSEKALLKEAVPPLRDGFETVKTKVTKPI